MTELAVVHLQEYEEKIVEGIVPAQARSLRDRFGAYLDVNPAWSGGFALKARQHVGVIVQDNLRVHIHPKVPVTNLFFMLSHAYDVPRLREEQAQLDMAEDLYEFIVTVFVEQVEGLAR